MINVLSQVKLSIVLCITVLFFSAVSVFAFDSERIDLYKIDIELTQEGIAVVTEEITYDFDAAERHGIYRYIYTDHPQEDVEFYRDRHLLVNEVSVTMDGEPIPYEVSESSDQVYIKIGDAHTTISGKHTYVISYVVYGGYSHFTDGLSEFYWNATGDEWSVPIGQVQINLHDPHNIFSENKVCYRGRAGASTTCITDGEDQGVQYFIIDSLRPYEGVTIAQSLQSEKVQQVILEKNKIEYFWIPALVIWFMLLGYLTYRYRTQYKLHRTVIPQYEPYKNFKPMYTGLLIDGNLDSRDVTAGILYLAEQGFLKIKKKDTKVLFFFEVDDYELTLLKPIVHIKSAFQKEIIKLLFGLYPVVGKHMTLHQLKKNTQRQKENYKLLNNLRKDLEKDLEDEGFFQVHIPTSLLITIAILTGTILVTFGASMLAVFSVNMIFLGVGILGSLGIVFTSHRRRTVRGYEAVWHLKGFKEFLSVTEKERYVFHNAPEKSPEQFMEYLPYAVAFGVEKEWAEIFKDITVPSPGWYDGDAASFSATNFTHSIGAFSTMLTTSAGSSGSSGSGSVGGGGGGGGGGSW